jgi:hypothetical protein
MIGIGETETLHVAVVRESVNELEAVCLTKALL